MQSDYQRREMRVLLLLFHLLRLFSSHALGEHRSCELTFNDCVPIDYNYNMYKREIKNGEKKKNLF